MWFNILPHETAFTYEAAQTQFHLNGILPNFHIEYFLKFHSFSKKNFLLSFEDSITSHMFFSHFLSWLLFGKRASVNVQRKTRKRLLLLCLKLCRKFKFLHFLLIYWNNCTVSFLCVFVSLLTYPFSLYTLFSAPCAWLVWASPMSSLVFWAPGGDQRKEWVKSGFFSWQCSSTEDHCSFKCQAFLQVLETTF